jgi:diguanylate cyclase (GGDEF)-like protein/PAS domain S-box-containing protein
VDARLNFDDTKRNREGSLTGYPKDAKLTMESLLDRSKAVLEDVASRIGKHFLLSVCFILLYTFLSSPAVIIVSHLGFTVWYPAIGLVLALFLGVSPWYLPLAMLSNTSVGALVYHQPLYSWSESLGSLGGLSCYAAAAYVLRGPLRIDLGLRERRDVVRYIFVTLCAAAGATAIGVAALAADHTITQAQYWSAAASWYAGDAIGLLGFAPFLLVHVLPYIRARSSGITKDRQKAVATNPGYQSTRFVEASAQFLSIPITLWIIFASPLASERLYYLAYIPIIWIAMRQGIRRVVTALVVFDFALVLTLRVFPVSTGVLARIGFLMLVNSGIGLIVGATVSERQRVGKELGEQTLYFKSLIENSPLGIIVTDKEGRVQLCNDAFETLFQFSREQIRGQHIEAFIVPHDMAAEAQEVLSRVGSGQKVKGNFRRKRKDGQLVEVELNAAPLVLDGKLNGTLAIYADVTARVLGAARLKDQAIALERSVAELQERRDQATLLNEIGALLQSCESSPDAIAVLADYGTKLFPSARSGALFIFKSSKNALEIEGKWGKPESIDSSIAPDSCWALRRGQPHWSEFPRSKVVCDHIKRNGSSLGLCVPMVARGETLGILHLSYDVDDGDQGSVSTDAWRQSQRLLAVSVATQVALSLTSLRLRESLRDQSIRDPLTTLFNRRFMRESLDREILRARRKGRPVAVIFIDIDHFKRFNDLFGHDAGDEVLRSFAALMRTFFRGDDVLCRYGGEEFTLILPESNEGDAAVRMTQFGEKVKEMVLLYEGKTLDKISISVGIAAFPIHGSSIEELLQKADQALYASKAQGRDRVTIASQLLTYTERS